MQCSLPFFSRLALSCAIALLASCDSGADSTDSEKVQYTEGVCRGNPGSLGSTIPWNSSVSYGSVTHGDQTYKTVKIGTQTWMAENLNYKVDSSWWFGGCTDSGSKYGRLYLWTAAMRLPDSCIRISCASLVGDKHQGICPSGWHMPRDTDWTTLREYVGGVGDIGLKLQSTTGWRGTKQGTDIYGFRALPAGLRQFEIGKFYAAGAEAGFWSSTEYLPAPGEAMGRGWSFNFSDPHPWTYSKRNAYSVRCLKDSP